MWKKSWTCWIKGHEFIEREYFRAEADLEPEERFLAVCYRCQRLFYVNEAYDTTHVVEDPEGFRRLMKKGKSAEENP